MKTVITARHLYTPTEEITDPLLVLEDGHISEISSRASHTFPTSVMLPWHQGFLIFTSMVAQGLI